MRSFSLTFDDGNYDESRYQAMLIKTLGADHSALRINNDKLTGHLVDTIWHTESPVLRTAPVPMGLLSGMVRENGFKVVLTGEGADEVLGGYDLFKEAMVRQFWAKYPESQIRPLLFKRLNPYLQMPNSGQASYLLASYLKRF